MNKLWVWLTAAFGLITLVGVVTVGLLAERQVSTNFRHFYLQSQLAGSPLVDQLTAYYAAHRTWAGVEAVFAANPGPGLAGRGMGRGATLLADGTGRIVYSGAGGWTGGPVAAADLADAVPLRVQNQPVGYLLLLPGGLGAMSSLADQFLAQLNSTLLQAGLLAGGLGLLLGLVLAWWLATPLARVAAAARALAAGDLRGRAPAGGPAEVAALAQDFNRMAASLQQAEQVRQNMVADIAHELRTPLSVLQGNLQALLDDVYPLTKAEIAGLYDETLVLHRLVTDLYELAQAEAGHLALAIQPTGLGPLVAQAQGLFAEAATAQGITLDTALPPDLPLVAADPDRVRQVLNNLLANALRHTPPGGTIRIMLSPAALREPAAPAALCLTVEDTGTGIAPEDLPHVFDRFWRADRARARGQGGAGLGLAIAKQLVEAQGGRIGVLSTRGQGSVFWFTLPLSPGEPSATG